MSPDAQFIKRCIELAEKSLDAGELPFGCVIVKNGNIIAESGNMTNQTVDATNHAEIIAMKEAQKKLGTTELSDCVIYTNYEPCAMCSYMIRELKFKKVVFAVFSPVMGGVSRWDILQDQNLIELRPFFGPPPEIISGLLEEEATKTFERYEGIKKYKRMN